MTASQQSQDRFDLQRFVNAQGPVYDQVLRELQAGDKQGHWMWFIFPQLKGLGHSHMAQHYGIGSREEAQAYIEHRVLGPRLEESTRLVNAVSKKSISEILGYPDDLKFRSSMTLFSAIAPQREEFRLALEKYFDGERDQRTLDLLA